MQKQKITAYIFEEDGEEFEVRIDDVTKVKVRKLKDDDGGDE